MSEKSKIEWTEATWNPVTGCTKVSQGCKNCYAERDWARLSNNPKTIYHGRKFTDVQIHESRLNEPLCWNKPRMVFVDAMSDLFHETVPDGFIKDVWLTMAIAKRHTFQILTKRAKRMQNFVTRAAGEGGMHGRQMPLSNVWLGVSVESADNMDRIEALRGAAAAVRFISFEPLLGDVGKPDLRFIDWVIVGGESGKHARPMHPYWVRIIRDQCKAAKVPFFFKQWGEWLPGQNEKGVLIERDRTKIKCGWFDNSDNFYEGDCNTFRTVMDRIGRAEAKRLGIGDMLDGREWKEFPLANER